MKKRPNALKSARQRAEVIMKVRCRLMSASDAASQFGVSRKTYYKWEQPGRTALLDSLEEKPPGRPLHPVDARQKALEKELVKAHRDIALLEHKMALKDVLTDLKLTPGMDRAKKNERIQKALAMIAEAKKRYAVSTRAIARQMGLSYDTLMRWKRRLAAGLPSVDKPGPKKVAPLDLAEIKQKKIGDLGHGRKRSRGTGRLHGQYADAISRRDLDRLVRSVRDEKNRDRKARQCRIVWLRPNLAWAMDDCRKHLVNSAGTVHLHNLGDLCSRYRFRPLAGSRLPRGEAVAGHLEYLFNRFGPPLFCKRDNGGNLNHTAVNDVLSEAMVVPINNPVYTASYNGAIEHTQGEFKNYLHRWQWKSKSICEAVLLAETAANDLNHRGRRSLGGKNACRAYFNDNRLRCTKRRRKDIYRWIQDLAADIFLAVGSQVITAPAWRAAAKEWLVKNGMIRILRAGIVLPDFPSKLCHN